MITTQIKSRTKVCGGELIFASHLSNMCHSKMNFSVFLPPANQKNKPMSLFWLSGLTCTEENFMIKAGAFKKASKLNIAIICPDTSPRGLKLPGEDDNWDFGSGAGFYLNAKQQPWSKNYHMEDYIVKELRAIIDKEFELPTEPMAISGHSMGGHGALTLALKNPELFKSVSAFAPICNPINCAWGKKAFTNYLGENEKEWVNYDATQLIRNKGWQGSILIDQGTSDSFLKEQLLPHAFIEACREKNCDLNFRFQDGYDHSYYFISSFIDDHLEFHRDQINQVLK